MKWCFVSPGYRSLRVLSGDTRTSGGAEAQIAYLAAALARMGHSVGMIYGDGLKPVQRSEAAGVVCIEAFPSWRRPASILDFQRAMNALSPDLLYARLPNDFLWMMGLHARTRPGSRFLYAMAHDDHCTPWSAYDRKRWFHAPLYWAGLRGAHAIAIQHDHQRGLLSPSLGSRLIGVPNLVRTVADDPRPYGAASIDAIWVAQIRPEKQLDHFLDLAAAHPDLRFAVVGGFDPTTDAEQRAALEARLLALGNLTFHGAQNADTVASLLARSKVLVNTSRAEGFPNTMLESWSLGVPVVSLSVDPGGVIGREGLGLISGSAARLRDDVRELACTEPLNRQCGDRGLAYVRRRHSLEAVCAALAAAFPGARPAAATAGVS